MASQPEKIRTSGSVQKVEKSILTADAVTFLTKLAHNFEGRRQELLAKRRDRQALLDLGQLPGFLPETAQIRAAEWKVAPIPADMMDRRVEITGPV